MNEPAITSVRVLLDGSELLKFGPDDNVEVEFARPFVPADDPAYNGADNRPIHFFRANGKCFAVTHSYECHVAETRSDEMVIELNSKDLIPDHVALGTENEFSWFA